jgi:hypothetical protein
MVWLSRHGIDRAGAGIELAASHPALGIVLSGFADFAPANAAASGRKWLAPREWGGNEGPASDTSGMDG